MRPSQALSLVTLLLLLASSSASVLQDTCRSFGSADMYTICIKFFKANKESALANKRGLAVIATGIVSATAVATRKRIAALITGDKDQKIQEELTYCYMLYSRAVGLFEEASKRIWSGKSDDAVKSLDSAMNIPRGCDDEFRKAGIKSPLDAENAEFEMECAITKAVTQLLPVV
ncbi:hypothetical protein ZWY2020_013042 [Hordeum vulgare]|nr:hypothetical protein ZWY2020_013042 [Hordeum vulgare]